MTISRSDLIRSVGFAALIALAACKPAPEAGNSAAPTPTPTPVVTGVKALPEAEQLKLAFRTVFGRDGTAVVDAGGSDQVTVKPAKLVWIGETAALLSPGASASDCHACSGALAIAYLKPKGDGFEVTGKWPALVRGSGWGQEPDWKITTEFTQHPAVYVASGWTGQGYTCSSATITELKPDGPVQSDLIGLSTSNEGAVDETTGKTFGGEPLTVRDGKIVEIVKGKSFAVKAEGKPPITERYEYRGGKFVPLVKESQLSC